MDYKRLLGASEWGEVNEIAIRMECTVNSLQEQEDLLDSGEKPDKEVVKDLINLFLSDVRDLEDIKDKIDSLSYGLYGDDDDD